MSTEKSLTSSKKNMDDWNKTLPNKDGARAVVMAPADTCKHYCVLVAARLSGRLARYGGVAPAGALVSSIVYWT